MLRTLAVLLLAAASSANAQIFLSEPSSARGILVFDVGAQLGQPVGTFRTNVDRAWGGGVGVRYHFRAMPVFGLRADVSLMNYGNERKDVPLSPTVNRVVVDMHTSNNIAVFSGGPELMLMTGPLRPYAYGFAGYSHFYTQSSANDPNGGTFASTTNFWDGGLAAGWGGGLRIPFNARSTEVAFDAGARFTHNGTRSYLTAGDIVDQPDGTLRFNERRTSADFWQYHVGVSFSPRRWR